MLRLSAAGMSKRRSPRPWVSATAARGCMQQARHAGLDSPLPEGLTDETLELQLYPPAVAARDGRPRPDSAAIHRGAPAGVTLQLLWAEHHTAHPDGYGYRATPALSRLESTAVADHRRARRRRAHVRRLHRHDTRSDRHIDQRSEDGAAVRRCARRVNYTYAEATSTQGLSIRSARTRAPSLSSVVSRLWWCPTICARASPGPVLRASDEPHLHRDGAHYNMPLCRHGRIGRMTRPKWKIQFRSQLASSSPSCATDSFSRCSLNAAIAELVAQINNGVSRHLGASRRALFEDLERWP